MDDEKHTLPETVNPDDILRLVTTALFRDVRNRKAAMFAGDGDSNETVAQCVADVLRNLRGIKRRDISLSTLVFNQVRWTLSRMFREAAARHASLQAFRELKHPEYYEPDYTAGLTQEEIRQVIDRTLLPRRRQVVKLRFGIECDNEHELRSIGKMLNVTRERVRQLEADAIIKLRGTLQPIFHGCYEDELEE